MFRTLFRTALGVALALGAVAAPAYADLSSAAEPSWLTNGEVRAITRIGNTAYLGGSFTYVGPFTGNGVVLNASTGARDAGWPVIEGGQVDVVVPDGSGGWFIGGDFDKVGGQLRPNIAHIRPDKTIDPTWNPVPDGAVKSMVLSSGYLYIGGLFGKIGSETRTRLAALSATTGVARADWTPSAGGANNVVTGMVQVTSGGTSWIVVAGRFSQLNGNTHRNIGRVRASDGASDGGWTPGVMDDDITTIIEANGLIVATGAFDEIDDPNSTTNIERHGFAAWNVHTAAPSSWTADVDGGFIDALAYDGSRLYVGGSFTSIQGEAIGGVAALDASSGNVDTAWSPAPQIDLGFPKVKALAVQGADLIVGGTFNSIGGQPRDYLASVSRSGAGLATAWQPNVMPDENTAVTALAVTGSNIYAGGNFRSAGGLDRRNLAALNVDTGTATPWNPGADGPVHVLTSNLATQSTSNDRIYVGGSFANVAGGAHANLVALDRDGNAVGGEVPQADGPVYALALSASGRLYVGGTFSNVGGQAREHIAAVQVPSATPVAWGSGAQPSVDGAVDAMALTSTRLYIGGNFGTVSGTTRPYAAALRVSDGGLDTWNPQPDGSVDALAASASGGPVFIGGSFSMVGASVPRRNLAAVDAVSGVSTSWRSDTSNGLNDAVSALALHGGTLYVGGIFTTVDSTARNRLAAVEVSDGDALPWNPSPTGTNSVVGVLLAVAGSNDDGDVVPGKVFVGGRFTQMGLLPRAGYASFNDTTDPPSNTSTPAITGTAKPGSTVTCSNGTWLGSPTFTRQWLVDDVANGATGQQYAPQAGDVGKVLKCRVSAQNVGGSATATSNGVTVQAADPGDGGGGGGGGGGIAPTILSPPAIGGTARAGSTLTCSDGTWNGTPAPTFARTWRVGGVDRGTSPSFTPGDEDAGKSVNCTVTATNASGSASVASASVTIAPRSPSAQTAPTITGNPVVGATLTCSDGTWSGSPTLSRQWLRSGNPVVGANAATYAVTPNDVGRTLRCRVTGTNAGGTADADSNEVTVTTPPKADPPATPKPRKPTIAAAALRLRAGAVAVRVTCYAACRGTVVVASGKARLGSGRLVRTRAGVAIVRVPLTRAGRQLVTRRGSLRVQVAATITGGGSVQRAITIRR